MARHVGVRATAHAIGRATRLDAEVALVVLRRTGDGVGFRTLQNLIGRARATLINSSNFGLLVSNESLSFRF